MKLRIAVLMLAVAALAFAGFGTASAQMTEGPAMIRVAHFSVDAPAVDVFVNGEAALSDFAYPSVSGYLSVPAGTYNIAVAPAGAGIDGAVIGPVDLTFAADTMYTIAATGQLGDGSFGPVVINETELTAGLELPEGTSPVIVLHGISDAPAVDVLANDAAALSGVAFNQFAAIAAPNNAFFNLKITAAGAPETVVFEAPEAVFWPNATTLVAAIGTFPSNYSLSTTAVSTLSAAEWLLGMSGNPIMSFDTLAAAADAAGLVDTLITGGPFTIFAPTDEAFAALPEGTIPALLADIPTLTSILLYHVVDGVVAASDVVAGLEASMGNLEVTTLNGASFTVDGDLMINGSANIIATDVFVRNGVLHIIDAVILPPAN